MLNVQLTFKIISYYGFPSTTIQLLCKLPRESFIADALYYNDKYLGINCHLVPSFMYLYLVLVFLENDSFKTIPYFKTAMCHSKHTTEYCCPVRCRGKG